jgi:hypothetical protein
MHINITPQIASNDQSRPKGTNLGSVLVHKYEPYVYLAGEMDVVACVRE